LFAVIWVLWGVPYVMIKVVVAEVSVPVLVCTRTAVGAAVLLPLAIRSGGLVMFRRYWLWVLAFTAFQVIGPWWLLCDAELRMSSSVSALFIAAAPTISVVLAPLFGDTERPTTLRLAGLLVGLAGVVLLAVTIARVAPTSPMSAKSTTNARAVHSSARPASAHNTRADGIVAGHVAAAGPT
jgi:drug/metabolite transporter (DMT)-like permease